jgi:LacI family transcriptional regulator
MVTIKEVAGAAGVSTQTVSRAISGKGYIAAETRTRVHDAIRRLGYTPNRVASSMATGRTMSIGMVVPDISYSFFPEIVLGAETEARRAGYTLLLCNTAESVAQEQSAIQFLHEARVDGVILGGARLPDSELLLALAVHQHFVSINHPVPPERGGSVRSDHIRGIALAVDHLAQGGRRAIGYLSGPEHVYAAQERLAGFMQAIETAGLALDPNLIVPYATNLPEGRRSLGEWLASGEAGSEEWHLLRATLGQRGALQLLQDHPAVDSIICYDDQMAVGALQACAQLGRRVPEDVAITGCNDLPLASQVTPRLTTQRIPCYEMGATAARLLIERIGGDRTRPEVAFQHQLIVRESAPAPARIERAPLAEQSAAWAA